MNGRGVVLCAGGTGGHLFPAFALAEELCGRGISVDLVTDVRGDRFGAEFPGRMVHQVPSATLGGKSPVAIARTSITLARGIAKAVLLLGRLKPSVVVGFGGYPTFPPLLGARVRSIATVIHEQNAVLGRANRMLASRVDKIAASFETTKYLDGALLEKVTLTGNPVRQIVLDQAQRPYFSPMLGETLSVVVFGGSQGARFFSDLLPETVQLLSERLRGRLHIVQQARQEDVARVTSAFESAGVGYEVAAFFKNLPEIIGGAHLVIGRAGASTVAELTVIGRPSILVPLPHALDNDQLQNASRLAESGGAWCIEQKDLGAERLADVLAGLLGEEGGGCLAGGSLGGPGVLAQVASAAKAEGRPDAVLRLADLVSGLVPSG